MKTFPFIPAIFGGLEGTGRICRVPARLIPGAPRVRLPREADRQSTKRAEAEGEKEEEIVSLLETGASTQRARA